MFGAILITFTITSLSMLALFLYFYMKKQECGEQYALPKDAQPVFGRRTGDHDDVRRW